MKFYIILCLMAFAAADSEDCGENQHYDDCGTACPVTCDNYEDPPLFCIRICVPGCHCDEDYVLTDDGRCVKPEECPSKQFSDNSKSSALRICKLPAEPGLCDALIPRFYFDTTAKQCRKFMYGGCGGNKNNFRTLDECQNTCGEE